MYLIFKVILSQSKGKSQASSIVSYFNKTQKKPNMEKVWANTFLLDDTYVWENIYTEKIKKIFDKNVSEFNYKLLHITL